MTREIILYKERTGVATKDVLREITLADQQYLKKVMICYLKLESVDPRPDFAIWFNTANPALPRQPKHNNQHNSPKTFALGIIEKLEQSQNRRDLSPRQCQGITELTELMSQIYEIPTIDFHLKSMKNIPASLTNFNRLF